MANILKIGGRVLKIDGRILRGDEYNSTQAYRFYFNTSNTMNVTYTPKTGATSVRLVKI